MRPSIRSVLSLSVVALPIVGYGVYIAGGGMLGREEIKARIALRTMPYSVVLQADGSGCEELGAWVPDSKTCVLDRNPLAGTNVLVAGDGVTIDGAGHSLVGDGGRVGLLIIDRSDVQVRNLEIRGFASGIRVQHSVRTRLNDLRVHDVPGHAIHLIGQSDFNTIADNVLGPTSPQGHGIAVSSSSGNLVSGNVVIGTRDAIRLQSAHGNTVVDNFTAASRIEAIDLHLSRANTIVRNDLTERSSLPLLDDLPAGANTYDLSSGGNYYAQYASVDQGCEDGDGDGFCDTPYRFFSEGIDRRPSTTRWTSFEPSEEGFDEEDFQPITPHAACMGCHALGQISLEDQVTAGPSIIGIVEAPVGNDPDFEYSEAMRSLGGTWTEARLHDFLARPEAFAPGTTMIGIAITDEGVRQQIIDFLRQGSS